MVNNIDFTNYNNSNDYISHDNSFEEVDFFGDFEEKEILPSEKELNKVKKLQDVLQLSNSELKNTRKYYEVITEELGNIIKAQQIDVENDPQKASKAISEDRFFAEYQDVNGNRHVAASSQKLAETIGDSEFLHLHDLDGNLQCIRETKNLNIRHFTAGEMTLLFRISYFQLMQFKKQMKNRKDYKNYKKNY